MRFPLEMLLLKNAVIAVAALLPLLLPISSSAQQLTPVEALEHYLAGAAAPQPSCSDSAFTVQIDASIPTLRKHGSMTGLKLVSRTGQIVYRGLRFTGDGLIKTAVIGRFLSSETDPAGRKRDVAVSHQNYWFTCNQTRDYNGLTAYVCLLNPRRKQAGLFRGELWLTADSGQPLRLWGDLVRSPSILVRSFRFVQDYQTVAGCSQPLRLVLTVRTRIAGTVELVVWQHPAADNPESLGAGESTSQFHQASGDT